MLKDSNQKHGIPFGWHVPSKRMVKATEVANGRACECICVACRARLQARQGAVRVWHFAHDEETNCQNAPEAAIHRMAKQMVVERGAIYVPHRQLFRTIHGKKRVWTEQFSVDVQGASLQELKDCIQEKTIGDSRSAGDSRRPDVFALLDGRPLAIEIRNTHAVDFDKQEWLEQQGYSILEIAVADVELLPPDQIPSILETRLFVAATHSTWLAHAGDPDGSLALDQQEAQIRAAHAEEERALLAKLESEELERKRTEEVRERYRDIEDFKISLGCCTVRIGRNAQRVSLKKYGPTPDAVFQGLKQLAFKHHGHFNGRGRCWEFHRHVENEAFFKQLCAEAQQVCLDRYCGTLLWPSTLVRPPAPVVEKLPERPLPNYFEDAALQEAFDERAGILEFEAGFDREIAEKLALGDGLATTAMADYVDCTIMWTTRAGKSGMGYAVRVFSD